MSILIDVRFFIRIAAEIDMQNGDTHSYNGFFNLVRYLGLVLSRKQKNYYEMSNKPFMNILFRFVFLNL